jgi:hypothetical protein
VRAWWFALALIAGFVAFPGAARAAEAIEVRSAALALSDDGAVLAADLSITLNQTLEETLNRGVPLFFALDFELQRPRWYWLNEKIATYSREYRLSYNALTRQYRVSLGTLFQSFETLPDAVAFMSRIRGALVTDRDSVRKGVTYAAAVRFRLDTSQLPRPFQLSAIGSREWNLASDWYRWSVTP